MQDQQAGVGRVFCGRTIIGATCSAVLLSKGPLNTVAVFQALGSDRNMLRNYGLDLEITEPTVRRAQNGKSSLQEIERRSYAHMLRHRESDIAQMRHRCEGLIVRVCLAEGNAQRLRIDPRGTVAPLASWQETANPQIR